MNYLEHLRQVVIEVTDVDVKKKYDKGSMDIFDARRIFIKLAIEYSVHNLVQIGRYLGKDHTTVIHYRKKHEHLIFGDKLYREKYHACLEITKPVTTDDQMTEIYRYYLKKARFYARKIKNKETA